MFDTFGGLRGYTVGTAAKDCSSQVPGPKWTGWLSGNGTILQTGQIPTACSLFEAGALQVDMKAWLMKTPYPFEQPQSPEPKPKPDPHPPNGPGPRQPRPPGMRI